MKIKYQKIDLDKIRGIKVDKELTIVFDDLWWLYLDQEPMVTEEDQVETNKT